jgi:predicted anti-sigma-YlaC factor YlaD
MDCHQAQEEILDSLEETSSSVIQRKIDAHTVECLDCVAFTASQKRLDAYLTAMLRPPEMSPAFRSILLKRIRQDKMRSWTEVLPDIVHFVSCAVATVLCAVLLPFGVAVVFGVGTIAALLTYVPLTMIRDSFHDGEAPSRDFGNE